MNTPEINLFNYMDYTPATVTRAPKATPKAAARLSPLLMQYNAMKAKHPDAVLLFRVGNFYECFSDDAVLTSKVLGITLTRRIHGTKPMALSGFPHHALDVYLPRLVRAGHRVAICEQLENPKVTVKHAALRRS